MSIKRRNLIKCLTKITLLSSCYVIKKQKEFKIPNEQTDFLSQRSDKKKKQKEQKDNQQ